MMRYFVDERNGCIAVRDRTKTNPEYHGLHADTEGVVRFWNGYTINTVCPTCGQARHGQHVVRDEDRNEAYRICNLQNDDDLSSNAPAQGGKYPAASGSAGGKK
jgi:hypothetical protein